MVLLYPFHRSIGLFAVFVNLVVVLTPELAAAASSSSSQSYLNQQALHDILGRAAPIAGIDQSCSKEINPCDWMAKLPDSTKLVHMSLPGTHDTSTWNYSDAAQASLTRFIGQLPDASFFHFEEKSVLKSLNDGIRVLDFHLLSYNSGNDTIGFYHSDALLASDTWMEDLFFGFYNWLDNHPTEAVLVSINHESGTGTPEDSALYMKLYDILTTPLAQKYWVQTNGTLGTLGQARGKLTLLQRFSYKILSSNLTKRIGIYLDPAPWTDNVKIIELADNIADSQVAFIKDSGSGSVSAQVVHNSPKSSNLNDLTFVLSGSGAPGIFDSSITPENEYGIYNWCNMPHVRTQEYKVPPKSYTLQYVEVIQRHHKRTPYASNIFFKEDIAWSCVGEGPVFAVTSTKLGSDVSPVQWQLYQNPANPWTSRVGPGFTGSTCQFPQITAQGLDDSITHGADLRAVYASRLDLGDQFDPKSAIIRVTHNVITSQVASGLLKGLFPLSGPQYISAFVERWSLDSLEPAYSCPTANTILSHYTTGSGGQEWQTHLAQATSLYTKLDQVSGISSPDTAGWHESFDHYYDNLSAKQCHGKSLPCSVNDSSICVTQDEADTVYRLGNWEYSYKYRDAPNSAQYSTLKFGIWVLDLKAHLQAQVDGTSKIKYFHNIAHDSSVSLLLGFLQITEMVWPGMGAEVVFELYSAQNAEYFIRVLWGGQPMETSTSLGVLDMVPLADFFSYIDSMIGSANNLFESCHQ